MDSQIPLIDLTADIVSSYVLHNRVPVEEVPSLVEGVYGALRVLVDPPEKPKQPKVPAVSVRASVKHDYLVCLECGTKHKMLKWHVRKAHGLTADLYRHDYNLPRDYPMIAPEYADRRRTLAIESGLGKRTHKRRGAKVSENRTRGRGAS
jgi:predicted transcriptional regulator